MRFLSADYIYPLHITPIKEGVIQISDMGKILNIFTDRYEVPKGKLEIFEGILCPGFVNAHCHLELSHLKGKSEKGKGFLNFVEVIQKRNDFCKDDILEAIDFAEKQMIKNGIVAVGDICNTSDTINQKQKGNLQYYNFIEVFGVDNSKSVEIVSEAKTLRDKFRKEGMKSTISPHAPYSVPPKLMEKISNSFDKKDETITIHNQETEEENQLFEKKSGVFLDWLKKINSTSEIWEKRNISSDILKEINSGKMLFVHNTFTKKKDISDNYYCTCPKANLHIENSLPDYSIFNVEKLCVGTDSLASNNSLSILEELKIIQENSDFDLNTLLKISSKNGAEALGFSDLGTFEKGKTPGVNLIKKQKTIIKLF